MKELIITERSNIVAIADAVRSNTGSTDELSFNEITNDINVIGSGTDTSDATATASDIMKDETAYVDGKKITGTFTIDSELTTQDDLITQIKTIISQKATYNTIYVGSNTPDSTMGVDGDIYIFTGGTV